jgi:hypothetical protein
MASRVRAMSDTEVESTRQLAYPGLLRRARSGGRASCGWATKADECRYIPRSKSARLTGYLHEVKGLPMKLTRIDELLLREGLRWHSQETWFGERVDAAFAETRGSSRRPIPRRRGAVW